MQGMEMTTAANYVEAGFVLVPIPAHQKGPRNKSWNLKENCIARSADVFQLAGKNIGLAHAYSGTCAIDIDDVRMATDWLHSKGVDLFGLLMDPATVQISSGRDNRAKLLYRLPEGVDPLPQKKVQVDGNGKPVVGDDEANHDMVDFRCGTANGRTVQDVLPPSIHPDTGKEYQWKGDWRHLPVLPDALMTIWQELAASIVSGDAATPPADWEPMDLNGLNLKPFTRRLIADGDVDGKYQGDRSKAMYGALKDLIRAGADDDVICRVLTDPDNGISEKPLENGRGSHADAMRWVANQIGKARAEVSGEQDMAKVVLLPVELDEDSLAMAFATLHKNDLRFCHTRNKWFRWDGKRWRMDETRLAFHWARELCRKYNRQSPTPSKTISKMRTAAEVEKGCKHDPQLAVVEDYWNRDPWLLATPDGTVDLKTGNARGARPGDHITLLTSVAPEAGQPDLWLRFLNQITRGEWDLQRFLCQISGYCLTGITVEHSLFFLYGPGGNGKSVFINVLMTIMGEYATSAPMTTFTASKYDQHPTDLADLAGARLVTASETEEGRAWAEARIKQMTGGDRIKARFMRQDYFEYQPQFKLVFLGNHKPVLQNVDDAARRRFNIVPLTFKPKQADTKLEDKLKPEHGRILSWMIAGCLDWQQNGLVRPKVVTDTTAEYFSDQDVFRQWLDECTAPAGDQYGETGADLYRSWRRYAEAAGEDAGNQKSFRDRMRAAEYEYRSHLPNNNGKSGFIRIKLPNPAPDDYKPYAD